MQAATTPRKILSLGNASKTLSHLDDIADLSVRDRDLNAGEVRIKTPLQGGHELYTRFLAGVDGLDRLGDIRRDGLLAEHMLPVRRARLDLPHSTQQTNKHIAKYEQSASCRSNLRRFGQT